jgi:hypothetical protein
MSAIELVEKSQLAERPAMKSGDTVRVHVKVREGDKERIQIFEGIVIGLHRGALIVYGPQSLVRAGRGAHLPAAFADDCEGRSRTLGTGPPRQALLPPRAEGQGGADEGDEKGLVGSRRLGFGI